MTKNIRLNKNIAGTKTVMHPETEVAQVVGLSEALSLKLSATDANSTYAKLTDIAGFASQSDISAAIDELISGAPNTYDTLKEIADFIAANEDTLGGLTDAIAAKLDAETAAATYAPLTALANKPNVFYGATQPADWIDGDYWVEDLDEDE